MLGIVCPMVIVDGHGERGMVSRNETEVCRYLDEYRTKPGGQNEGNIIIALAVRSCNYYTTKSYPSLYVQSSKQCSHIQNRAIIIRECPRDWA